MQKGTLEAFRNRVDRETQAQRTADRREVLKSLEAKAGADTSVGGVDNPSQTSKALGSDWGIRGRGIK